MISSLKHRLILILFKISVRWCKIHSTLTQELNDAFDIVQSFWVDH